MFFYTLIEGYYVAYKEGDKFVERGRMDVKMAVKDPSAWEVLESVVLNFATEPYQEYYHRYLRDGYLYLIDFSLGRVLLDKGRRMSEYGILSGNLFSIGSQLA